MRTVLSRLRGGSPVTGCVAKRCERDECVKVTAGNLTMSDTIVLGALIGCLLVLSHVTPIEYDNPRDHSE